MGSELLQTVCKDDTSQENFELLGWKDLLSWSRTEIILSNKDLLGSDATARIGILCLCIFCVGVMDCGMHFDAG